MPIARPLTFAAFALACAMTTHAATRGDGPPEIGTAVGQAFPDVALPKLDGGHGRLSDHRGKRVFLFVFASW